MSKNYEAFEALKKEAENGDVQAQCTVGDIYADDTREVYNINEAVFWCKKAAEQGCKKAQWLLGASYSQGIGITKDLEQAELWLKKSANGDDGNANGQYALAGYYIMMKPDIVKAKYWLEKAAEQGFDEAKTMLPAISHLFEI
jgi:hypothetical protein